MDAICPANAGQKRFLMNNIQDIYDKLDTYIIWNNNISNGVIHLGKHSLHSLYKLKETTCYVPNMGLTLKTGEKIIKLGKFEEYHRIEDVHGIKE